MEKINLLHVDSAFRTTLTNLKAKDGLVASNGRLCTMTGLYVGQKENGRIELSYNEDNALKVEAGVIHNIETHKPRKERRKLSADELELKKEYQKLVQTDLFARYLDDEKRNKYKNKITWRN